MLISNLAPVIADATQSEGLAVKLMIGLIGIGGVVLGFFLNQYHQESKEKIKELKEYIATLQSAANELEFYGNKLKQLSEELDRIAIELNAWRILWIVPTYSIYPNFLEKCKITINRFQKNPNLVKEVGNCHFELCHILERLNLLKTEMRVSLPTEPRALTEQLKTHRVNVEGFKGLVDDNIPVFKAACDLILCEKVKMENSLKLQRERSLFSSAED